MTPLSRHRLLSFLIIQSSIFNLQFLPPASAQSNTPLVSPSRLGAFVVPPSPSPASGIASRLVRITVTFQTQNPFQPWLFQAPDNRSGYGILIAPGEVLTTEHLVRNHTHVELLRARTGEKIAAKVTIADPRLNLALLTLPAHRVGEGLPALTTAGPLRLHEDITIAQFDDDEDLQTAQGTVSQIAVDALPDGPFSLLAYQVLMQLNATGEGAPALVSNELAGIVTAYQSSTRIATVIGAPFIARFLEDAHTPPYQGPASGGFMWKPLVDPAKRDWLKLGDERNGIMVVSTQPGSGAEATLRSMDVILSWDGHPFDALGYYEDPDFGRIEFTHLVKGKGAPGDSVPISIWRDGAQQTVNLTLGGDPDLNALVPENVAGARAPYLMTGGFVMRELDVYTLRAYGQDWRAKVDPQLLHFYIAGKPDQKPGDRIVVLTGILPDIINVGYQHLRSRVVTAVNGTPVCNMREVFDVADRDGLVDRLTIDGIGVDLVLNRAELPAANDRLMHQYRIPTPQWRAPLPSAQSTNPPIHQSANPLPPSP